MNEFYKALTYVNENFYKPSNLKIENIQEEIQNEKYGAGIFRINSKTVRFRVARITPKKKGQFIACWEKDSDNNNQAYSYENTTDLLVVNTFGSNHDVGQFIFPKEILLKHNILKTDTSKGKMALRVYPSWDTLSSKQAIATQSWQSPYFINLNHPSSLQEFDKYFQ
ncbi:MepB family protein [Paenibacillus sp. CMAA1364]